jgi:hypothetical protein
MDRALSDLLAIAGEPIGLHLEQDEAIQLFGKWGAIGEALAQLLNRRNGFYAFDSALLVRPLKNGGSPLGLVEWNMHGLWKEQYVENLADMLFFAEDGFGGQFAIRNNTVCCFDPETGQFEVIGPSLDAWVNDLLNDYEFRTGYPLVHAWQERNAHLAPGMRLVPKIPFVCGGRYEVNNLYSLNEVKGMQFRASIARQIRDLPDGSQVILDISPTDP